MHNTTGADSLQSLQYGIDSVVTGAEPAVSISTEEMFGAQSCVVETSKPLLEAQTLVSDTLFQILAVAMMIIVIFFIARQRHRITTMFVRMLKGRLSDDLSSGRRDEVITRSFLHAATTIGVMLVTLFAAKYAPLWMPASIAPSEGFLSMMAVVYTLVAIIAITLFESALLWIVGQVTRSSEHISVLLYLKRAYFALAATAMSPIFLLGVLSSESMVDTWNILLITECAILVFMFLKETLVFFLDKKIPIFHWILYLCAAEAFPLTLIWALITRS